MSRNVYGHRDLNWGPVSHTLKMKIQGHNVWKRKETSYRRQDPSRDEKFSGSYSLHIYSMVTPPIFPLVTMTKQSKLWEACSFPSAPRLMSSQVSYAWLVCSLDHKGKEMWFDSQQLFEARNVAWWRKTACGRLYKKYYSVILVTNIESPKTCISWLPAPVHVAVKQEVTDVKTMHLFLHTLVQLSCFVSVYLLIFFTAQPCICIGDLDRQLLCTFNNFFPFLAGNIVCNFCSIALVGHKKDFKFLKQQKWKIIIIKTSCECQLWAVNL